MAPPRMCGTTVPLWMPRCSWPTPASQDVLQIAGQQQKFPLTGTIAVNAKAQGTLENLNGEGKISLTKGVAYGEPYDSAIVDLAVHGQDFEASNVALSLHGMQITGNGGYDLTSKHLHAHSQGNNLVLSKFETVARPRSRTTMAR